MCNEINLEELEALANAAGGLKWIACGPSYGEAKPAFLDEVNVDDDEYPEAVCQYPAGCRSDVSDKMAYIAEANPATLLSLLDRLKSAEAERDALAARLAELLYARPIAAAEAQQAGPVRLTDNDVVDLFQTWNTTYGTSHADLIRAVETAVLERNGLNPQAKAALKATAQRNKEG